jgi:hypothetical protein
LFSATGAAVGSAAPVEGAATSAGVACGLVRPLLAGAVSVVVDAAIAKVAVRA